MESDSILYKIAFSFLKKITASRLREIAARGVSGEEFFTLPTRELLARLGMPQNHDFDILERQQALALAERELENISRHNIRALFLLDSDYPYRLAETYEPPIVLYKLGTAALDGERLVSVVGTRKPTPYGIGFCERIVGEIASAFPGTSIVSGLAYGIDARAHATALESGLPTIAVVAHGLNMIYPAAHRQLAKDILKAGGAILSEYPFGTQPFKGRFLARNRIVAGISDATIVVESNVKGGAMSTANFAFMFNREVLALPGRSSDDLSSGCNHLIRKNKAHLIEGIPDIVAATGWTSADFGISAGPQHLFPELDGEARKIHDLLKNSASPLQIDEIMMQLAISPSKLLAMLGELEFDGVITRHPGNRFSLS